LIPPPYDSRFDSSQDLLGGGSIKFLIGRQALIQETWAHYIGDYGGRHHRGYYIGVTGGPTDTVTITLAAAVLPPHITLVAAVLPPHIKLLATAVDNHRGYYIGLQRLFSNPRVLTADHYTIRDYTV